MNLEPVRFIFAVPQFCKTTSKLCAESPKFPLSFTICRTKHCLRKGNSKQMSLIAQNPHFTLMESVNHHMIKFSLFNQEKLRRALAQIGAFLNDDLLGLICKEVLVGIEKKQHSVVATFASSGDDDSNNPSRVLFGCVFVSLRYEGKVALVHRASYSYRVFVIHEIGASEAALLLALQPSPSDDSSSEEERECAQAT